MSLQIAKGATIATGLTSAEARRRLAEFGPNAIADQTPSPWRTFLAKFWGPIPWMLEAAVALQLGREAYFEAAAFGGLLLFNTTLGFIQESRAGAALAALKKRLAPTALVRRDGDWIRISASQLVPGDLIRLPLGALVPADATIVSGSVMADQSMLTGESIPVDAIPGSQVYAGSLVRRGQAIAEVTATGSKTYFGRTAELVRVAHAASTEQAAIFGVTRNLALVNGTIAAVAWQLIVRMRSFRSSSAVNYEKDWAEILKLTAKAFALRPRDLSMVRPATADAAPPNLRVLDSHIKCSGHGTIIKLSTHSQITCKANPLKSLTLHSHN